MLLTGTSDSFIALTHSLNELTNQARLATRDATTRQLFKQSLLNAVPLIIQAASEIDSKPSEYLTTEEARVFLNLGKGTLDTYRKRGAGGPPFYRAGTKILYKRSDLEQWLAPCHHLEER